MHDSSTKAVYFEFVSCTFEPEKKLATFSYAIGFSDGSTIPFTETLELPEAPDTGAPDELIERYLNDLHLVLGISYYKLFCPPEIRLPRSLSKGESTFWNTLYQDGLGEFSYRNNLDLRNVVRFPSDTAQREPEAIDWTTNNRVLVGIGGGKDSVVALELLKADGRDVCGFVIETNGPHQSARAVAECAALPILRVTRTLDEKVYGEPLPGSYQGHIPISAVYAFIGSFLGVLYGYRFVAVANEASSSVGNIEWQGREINHQWSKSLTFEQLFRTYERQFVTSGVTYFSLMRPFSELRIAKLFARYPNYFSAFTSCNRLYRIMPERRPKGNWCGECPKCAFAFLILAPFIEKETLVGLFGKSLFDDETLISLFADILGFGTMKPFDCVGTFEEAQAALYLIRDTYHDSLVVKEFIGKVHDGAALVETALKTVAAPSVPPAFRFLGMERALILGYGREGKATEHYVSQRYPALTHSIADEATDSNALLMQDTHDIGIRTAGMPKQKVRMHYTTATNEFFAHMPNVIIGVTGSKGKSTTASLIHHLLTHAGVPSVLAGNIGKPMLDLLCEPPPRDAVIVLELSSYQLDDIEFSPHIAVLTSLFPDHMDYHGSLEAYYEAKRRITAFQERSDVCVYNPEFPELSAWAEASRARAMPYLSALPFPKSDIPLLGAHNEANVRGAVTVAKHLGVSDEAIAAAVRTFTALPHRLELVGEFRGIRFYDDAISTTPESTIAALGAIHDVDTLMLGGKDRGYDFSALENVVREKGVRNLVLFPESGARMLSSRTDLNILETKSMKEAVAFAYANTKAGKACVLSTASPSYSLWKDFEEKGNEFQKEVRAQA